MVSPFFLNYSPPPICTWEGWSNKASLDRHSVVTRGCFEVGKRHVRGKTELQNQYGLGHSRADGTTLNPSIATRLRGSTSPVVVWARRAPHIRAPVGRSPHRRGTVTTRALVKCLALLNGARRGARRKRGSFNGDPFTGE
eukprot:sb/3474273/